jgi:hypothetical protein
MRRSSALAVLVALVLGFATLSAALADPRITMSGPGWQTKRSGRAEAFFCEVPQCGGEAGVVVTKQRVLANTEEELNKPYVNIRAFMNERLLYMQQERGFRDIKVKDIRKATTPDYTAVHMLGTVQKYPLHVLMIVQGGNAYIIASFATTTKQADANLAAALKSTDFSRPH